MLIRSHEVLIEQIEQTKTGATCLMRPGRAKNRSAVHHRLNRANAFRAHAYAHAPAHAFI